jgi:hypothetical protein
VNRFTFIKSLFLTLAAAAIPFKSNKPKFGHYDVSKPPYPNMRMGDWICVSENSSDMMQNKCIMEADDIEGWIRYWPTDDKGHLTDYVEHIRKSGGNMYENNLNFRIVYKGKDKRFLQYS